VIGTPGGKRHTDSIFVGINWNFASKAPELVVGLRSLSTKADKKSSGIQLDLVMPFLGGFSFDRVRLAYVGGQRSALGELGLGYSFAKQTPLVMAGLQVEHFQLGVDYLISGTALPYVGLNSLRRPRLPTGTSNSLGCEVGTLTPVSSLDPSAQPAAQYIVDGQTCYNQGS
jgi:hypothetical protein